MAVSVNDTLSVPPVVILSVSATLENMPVFVSPENEYDGAAAVPAASLDVDADSDVVASPPFAVSRPDRIPPVNLRKRLSAVAKSKLYV